MTDQLATTEPFTYTTMAPPGPGPKTLQFPRGRSIGRIFMRDWGTSIRDGFFDFRRTGMKELAEARGEVAVPADKEVSLVLASNRESLQEGLAQLRHDDLQYLVADYENDPIEIDDNALEPIGRLGGLVGICLHRRPITDAGLARLGHLSELRHIDLHWCDDITDVGIKHLTGLKKVETFFGAFGPRITDASYEVFGGWDTLRQIRSGHERITDRAMEHLARCKRLTTLFVPEGVTWRGLAQFADHQLVRLLLSGNKNIDNAAIAELVPIWQHMASLRLLDLSHTALSNDSVPLLSRLRQVKDLKLYKSGVKADGIAEVEQKLNLASKAGWH